MGPVKESIAIVSLIKGGLELEGGKFGLCSDLLRKLLGHEVGVLMGANVVTEVARVPCIETSSHEAFCC